MDWLWVFLIVFLAIFTQSVTGFGVALVSMPLLTALLGIQTAAPLVALVSLIGEFILLIYYRDAFNMRVVWRLILAAVFGVPLGVLALRYIPETVVLTLLGLLVGGYALYALLDLRLPAIQKPIWAYGAGFFAGILGGAYNTPGPPVILYGNCRRWPPAEFKSNLQGFFMLNSFLIVGTHVVAQNYTPEVWRTTLIALPALAAGIIVGLLLASRISNKLFRRIVLWMLLLIGVWLVVISI
jgi:uncharacterized membrane protein YfcA